MAPPSSRCPPASRPTPSSGRQTGRTAAHASAREHVGELPWTAGNFKDRLRQGLENWWNNLDASELKLPEFNTEDFSLPEFRLPDIELPDWANEFIGKEKAPENSDARNPV